MQLMEKQTQKETLKEYGRGIAGGLIFSLPLLYTMEVWWRGFTASPSFLLGGVIGTYLLLLGYNLFSGMRKDHSFWGVLWDSVEEISLAFFVSFVFLMLIGKVSLGMSLYEITGKVIVESMIVAIGISVGSAQMGKSDQEKSGTSDSSEKGPGVWKMVILGICGAVLISSSVAPTEEILMIAVETTAYHQLLMVLMSLLIAFLILAFIDFIKTSGVKRKKMKLWSDLVICYLSAFVASAALLYFFGRFDGFGFDIILAQIIVLSVAGTLGASAGRLLIK